MSTCDLIQKWGKTFLPFSFILSSRPCIYLIPSHSNWDTIVSLGILWIHWHFIKQAAIKEDSQTQIVNIWEFSNLGFILKHKYHLAKIAYSWILSPFALSKCSLPPTLILLQSSPVPKFHISCEPLQWEGRMLMLWSSSSVPLWCACVVSVNLQLNKTWTHPGDQAHARDYLD